MFGGEGAWLCTCACLRIRARACVSTCVRLCLYNYMRVRIRQCVSNGAWLTLRYQTIPGVLIHIVSYLIYVLYLLIRNAMSNDCV